MMEESKDRYKENLMKVQNYFGHPTRKIRLRGNFIEIFHIYLKMKILRK